MKPKITVIVPCYNYAQYLPECMESVLGQTHPSFEVLIIDDCSKDNTPAVAQSFKDERVRYVRNEKNLGASRTFNRGIELSRGDYVIILSADDRLAQSNALAKLGEVLDLHPRVGHVFAPLMRFETGQVPVADPWFSQGPVDRIISGREFLERSAQDCFSVFCIFARKECYEKCTYFPPEMPSANDWYVQCVFALYYDVGYIAEPLLHWRGHPESLSLRHGKGLELITQNLLVRLGVRERALAVGNKEIALVFEDEIVVDAAKRIALKQGEDSPGGISLEEFQQLIRNKAGPALDWQEICSRVQSALPASFEKIAEDYLSAGKNQPAARYYGLSLVAGGGSLRVRLKALLCRLGPAGAWLRKLIARRRRVREE